MPRKKKVDQLIQETGKEETAQPTTLEQILGSTGLTKYGTLDENEYRKQLDAMNKVDLQAHATKMNLVPIEDRNRLVRSLLNEFRVYASSFRNVGKTRKPQKVSEEVEKILATGR